MNEDNRLAGRVKRYARVSGNLGGMAARLAGRRALGRSRDHSETATELTRILGGLKGPLMKVAQMLATVPDLLPEEYATELAQLQAQAPAMGWPFVKRRMQAELGAGWTAKYAAFERPAAAAASLGQVHKARHHDGRKLAVKLQYPDMPSAIEADLQQLKLIFSLYRRMDNTIDTREIREEIGARLREELDYLLESRHMALYRAMLAEFSEIAVPETVDALSTGRLLSMTWLDGQSVLAFRDSDLESRNRIARAMFLAWWSPFTSYGAIHGDPHLGNYTVTPDLALNLLDFGCIRTFRPAFVEGVIDLYRALRDDDKALAVHAYETWGFTDLSSELLETLNIWAGFIYGPILDDRVRTVADGIEPAKYGREEAAEIHFRLRKLGPLAPPREFVFMDRAAVGLGSVFLHLHSELNWHQMFEQLIGDFDVDHLAARQAQAFSAAGVPLPG